MLPKSTPAREGSLDAPFRHAIAWRDPAFYDLDAIEAEMERVCDICSGKGQPPRCLAITL